ncbi:MAG: hypothetical protein LBC88_06055 [Spirochaetaceae bacterium]|jgi:hypothetical protein|nr:hypothetical protein [Spirochaetaceae bacterium]
MKYVGGISAKLIIDNLQQIAAAVEAEEQICILSAGHCPVKLAQVKGFANICLVYAMFERRRPT